MTTRLAQTLYALGVVAVLLTVTVGRAATPSFDSFDTNDFRVVKTTAPWKILSNTANTTNNFTNVVVNYINSTIINTNTIITNVNTTIINTNTTILVNGTNIPTINPTIGRVPYKAGTNDFEDSSLYFIDTNTTGTATLEVTDLANGGVVVSLLSGIVTNLSNGTGALTNDGAGNLGWSTIQGADLWTNNAGILEPVDLTLQPMVTRWYVGTNSPSYFGATDMALNAVRQPDTGESQVTGMALYSVSTNGAGYFDVNMGTNVSFASMAWNVGTNAGRQATFRADSTEAKFLLDNLAGDEVWSVNDLGVMRWTPTNAMFLSGNDLVITNSAGSGIAGLEVATGDGTRGRFSAGGNLALVEGALGVGLWDSLVTPRELRWAGNRFWPLQSGTDLGGDVNSSTKTPFQSVSSITNSLWGYIGGNVTNWSRLMMTHAGTNGVGSGIAFESQASGAGGNPRPFVFTNAPVQLPWFTSLQKTNLAEVANGMLIYQTDNTPGIRAYVNGAWVILNTSADP